jgi:hypothetical protein
MAAFTLHACINTAWKYSHCIEGCLLHASMHPAQKHLLCMDASTLQGSIHTACTLHGPDEIMHTTWS